MFAICLIFSGMAFFLNGFLPLIDENDNNEVVILNVLSGLVVSIISIFGILTATETAIKAEYASLLLIGITHLFISAVCIWDLSETSLGWFSALVCLIAAALGVYYIIGGRLMLGVLWLVWMLIWLAYFVSRSLDILKTPSNWVIMLEGALALCVEGVLLLTGITAL